MKRLTLAAFVVLVIAALVFAALYQHRRQQQRVQQLLEASTAISSRFQAYATALKNADFVTAYRYFSAEFQRTTSLDTFRDQQLRYGAVSKIQRGLVQTEYSNDSAAGSPVGFVVATIGRDADTAYLAFKSRRKQATGRLWRSCNRKSRSGAMFDFSPSIGGLSRRKLR